MSLYWSRGMCVRSLGIAVVAATLAVASTAAGQSTSLPPSWSSQDVGGPVQPGAASAEHGTFTISAGGSDIWGTADQFHFAYQLLSGNLDIKARVDSLTPADGWSKVGLMIRSSLDPDAAHAFGFVSAAHGLGFQRRTVKGGLSAHTTGAAKPAPVWVRLVRQGTTVTAYSSADGSSWTEMGSDTIALADPIYVGVAATSHVESTVTTATVSQLAVTSLALPTGQQQLDIGSPGVAGTASYNAGTYTVTGAGRDIGGTSDQFDFVYQPVAGNLDVAVRVGSLTGPSGWSKTGVMIRESLSAKSANAMAAVTTAKGYSFQRRAQTGQTTDATSGGAGAAPGWVRLVRTGSRFDAYRSSDGKNWTPMGSDDIPMADTVYVGIAITSHTSRSAAKGVFDSFTLTQGTAPPNAPPTVSLTSPATGASFTAPATIAMTANASDPEGQLQRVEFYAGTTRVGTATAAPYSATWSSVPAGTYTLSAIAYDAAGASATSASITVVVATAPTSSVPRAVVFHESADDATLVTSYRLDVFASGADPATATPVATVNLGKPAPDANGDITVDESSLFSALAPGNYLATVSAVGSGGSSRSAAVTFTR